MEDVEKGVITPASIPPPPAYQPGDRASFHPHYEHFVNVNLRDHPDEQAAPVQAFDNIALPPHPKSKWASKRRQAIYFGIGCLFILGIALVGVFVLGRKHGDKAATITPKAEAITVTETATPSSTSNSSISVSISVSTHISKTTKTATKTVATTAPIPKSILNAASSFYGAMSTSIAEDLARGRSIMSAALTKYPESTKPPTTLITTITPTPTTVVQTTTAPAPASDDDTTTTKPPAPTLPNWSGKFCVVPGQACY